MKIKMKTYLVMCNHTGELGEAYLSKSRVVVCWYAPIYYRTDDYTILDMWSTNES